MIITKKCTKCKEEKTLNEFRKQTKMKDGHKPRCKVCDSQTQKKRYKKNKAAIKTKVREWQAANPEKTKQYKKIWAAKRAANTPKPPEINNLNQNINLDSGNTTV